MIAVGCLFGDLSLLDELVLNMNGSQDFSFMMETGASLISASIMSSAMGGVSKWGIFSHCLPFKLLHSWDLLSEPFQVLFVP